MGVHLYASIHSSYSCRVPVTLMRYIILLSAAYSTLTRRGRGLNLQRGGGGGGGGEDSTYKGGRRGKFLHSNS